MPKTIKVPTYTHKVNDAAQELIGKIEMWIEEEHEQFSYFVDTGGMAGFSDEAREDERREHEQRINDAKAHIEYIKENLTLYDLEI